MHLYRSFAFLLSRMMTDNGGYFVCRTRHLVLAGSSRVTIYDFLFMEMNGQAEKGK